MQALSWKPSSKPGNGNHPGQFQKLRQMWSERVPGVLHELQADKKRGDASAHQFLPYTFGNAYTLLCVTLPWPSMVPILAPP